MVLEYSARPICPELSFGIEDARQRFADWHEGKLVTSGLVRVGMITPQYLDSELRYRIREETEDRGAIGFDDPLWESPDISPIYTAMQQIVAVDRANIGIEPNNIEETRRLLYMSQDGMPHLGWHDDGRNRLMIKWALTLGISGIVGAVGGHRRNEYDRSGRDISAFQFASGDVVRIRNGDVHKSPDVQATRVQVQIVDYLKPKSERLHF